MENVLLHTSSSPHIRRPKATRDVMLDVIIALLPTAVFGVWHFGFHAFLVLAVSVVTAVLAEFLFCKATRRKVTVGDYSAAVTGLLLGLVLSPSVPLYIPFLGSLFAVIVCKCCFGGLGRNFINPALAGRCFLLISFGIAMTNYTTDTYSGATLLAVLKDGGAVSLRDAFFGFTNGTIAISNFTLLLGGIYLLACGVITWHIPVSFGVSLCVAVSVLSGKGFDLGYMAAHLCNGGFMIAAFFMATDPVTNPVTPFGHVIYGIFLGVMTAVFRLYGNVAENISYCVLMGNLLTPLIDKLPEPRPFGIGVGGTKRQLSITPAIVLLVITLIAGVMLGGVYTVTKAPIEAAQEAATWESYKSVMADADGFSQDDAVKAIVESEGAGYGAGAYGNVTINTVLSANDASGNQIGYVLSVSTFDGFDGEVTLSLGVSTDGTVTGIAFTTLNETAGMGMRVDEQAWKDQFTGKKVSAFVLNKAGGSTADEEIDTVSGASTTSGAVVNAVNAGLDFYAAHLAA